MLETVDFIYEMAILLQFIVFWSWKCCQSFLVITFSSEISRLIKKIIRKSFQLNKCPTDYLNVQLEMFKYAVVTLFGGLSFSVKISPYVENIYSVQCKEQTVYWDGEPKTLFNISEWNMTLTFICWKAEVNSMGGAWRPSQLILLLR